MGFVISINQIKGGAGKTTTAINLAGCLIELNYKACVLDMDIEKPDAFRWAAQSDDLNNKQNIQYVYLLGKEKASNQIAKLKQKYDYVVLDTPPNNNEESFKAILLSDLILLPCAPSPLDQFNIEVAVELPSMSGKPFYLLATRVEKRQKLSIDLLKEIENSGFGLTSYITKRVDVVTSVLYGKWVGDYLPNGESHKEFKNLAHEILKKSHV